MKFELTVSGVFLPALTSLKRIGLDPFVERTIEVLNLNALQHREQRRQAILGALGIRTHRIGRTGMLPRSTLSIKAAKRLLDDINLSDSDGRIQPFCAAIERVLRKWVDREEKKAARLKNKPG